VINSIKEEVTVRSMEEGSGVLSPTASDPLGGAVDCVFPMGVVPDAA